MSILVRIDDKHVPIYRVMWVSATPHFCGEPECQREGYYEVQLEQGETLWASGAEHDLLLKKIEAWQGDPDADAGTDEDENW